MGPLFVACSVGWWARRPAAAVKVERPWTNDLDRGEDRRMLLAAEKDGVRGSGHGRLPVRRDGRWVQESGWGARAPSLISVHAVVGASCGDMMIDGVSRKGCGRWVF